MAKVVVALKYEKTQPVYHVHEGDVSADKDGNVLYVDTFVARLPRTDKLLKARYQYPTENVLFWSWEADKDG